MATIQGKLLFASLLTKFMPKGKKGDSPKAMGFELNDNMVKMVSGFTVIRLINMASGMLNLNIGKEDLLELNAKLNKIKKGKK